MNLSELGSAISLDESTNTVQTENLRLLQIILTEEITTKGLTPDQQNITQYGKELEALYDEILDLTSKIITSTTMHTHRGFCLPIFSTMQFAPCFFHAVLAHIGQSSCLVSSRPPVRFRQTAPSQRAVRPLPLPHHVAVFSEVSIFRKEKIPQNFTF